MSTKSARPKRSITGALVAGLAIWAVAAGCGGDGGEEASTPKPATQPAREAISKPEFVRRVNRRCAKVRRALLGPEFRAYQRRQERALRRGDRPPPAREFYGGSVAPAVRDLVKEIRALPVPRGDEKEVEALLDAAQRGAERLRKHPGSVQSVKPPFWIKLKSSRTLKRASVLARSYGVKRCAT